MGCNNCKVTPTYQSTEQHGNSNDNEGGNIRDDSIPSKTNVTADDAIIAKPRDANDHVEIQIADPQTFNDSFVQQRLQAIENSSYQHNISSCQPQSLK